MEIGDKGLSFFWGGENISLPDLEHQERIIKKICMNFISFLENKDIGMDEVFVGLDLDLWLFSPCLSHALTFVKGQVY